MSKRRDDDDGQQLSSLHHRWRQFPPQARARHTYWDKNIIQTICRQSMGRGAGGTPPCIGIRHIIMYTPSSTVGRLRRCCRPRPREFLLIFFISRTDYIAVHCMFRWYTSTIDYRIIWSILCSITNAGII